MPRGYRRIVIAAVGWLALCGAQPPIKQLESAKRAPKASPTAQSSSAPLPSAAASPTAEFTPYPDYNADACYKADDKDAADLCAQWRAAIAAEKAAHEARRTGTWSIIATILSLATVIGLIITIWQTNGALGEARRGNRLNLIFERRSRREARKAGEEQERALVIAARNADAASTLAESSRNADILRLRAYINVAETRAPKIELSKKIYVESTVANYGQTPAYDIKIRTHTAIIKKSDIISIYFPDIPKVVRQRQPEILARGQNMKVGVFTESAVDNETLSALLNNDLIIMFWCEITYTDVFGQVRETHVRRFANSPPERRGLFQFVATPNGNSAT